MLVFVVVQPFGNKRLSHSAVEKYITSQFNASDVTCNGGSDFEMKKDGATFTCAANGNQTYTVTINNKDNGAYTVQPSG